IAPKDILQVVMISVVTVGVLLVKWKDLMLYCFDANQARTLGLKAGLLHMLLLGLLAATSVAALQAVGAILVLAMLVTPGATAYLLTDRFDRMLIIATASGIFSSVFGTYISYYLDGATGGCIVVLQTLIFVIVMLCAPKHGILRRRP
ncbi:MAG: metal ABC transporter permease, partial [Alkalinema sp. RL_2_19]|nr:metal ABC transporter permease [Alkalinema sp. RL_2_19]